MIILTKKKKKKKKKKFFVQDELTIYNFILNKNKLIIYNITDSIDMNMIQMFQYIDYILYNMLDLPSYPQVIQSCLLSISLTTRQGAEEGAEEEEQKKSREEAEERSRRRFHSDSSDLGIDNDIYFGSGHIQSGRNTKLELQQQYIAQENLRNKNTIRVFRDNQHNTDQIGYQIYDLDEKHLNEIKNQELINEKKQQEQAKQLLYKQTAIAREFAIFAEKGEIFLKHGRKGFPHARRITIILLKDHKTVEARWGPGESYMLLRKNDAVLLDGKQTKVFRRSTAKDIDANLCFSLVNSIRSLDLHATTQHIKDKWFRGLKLLVLSLHHSS